MKSPKNNVVSPMSPDETRHRKPACQADSLLAPQNASLKVASEVTESTERNVTIWELATCVAIYSACSATLLVVNKVSLHFMPAPGLLLFLQLTVSALAVQIMMMLGVLPWEPWEFEKVKAFIGVVLGFLGVIYANAKVLQNANVETFIVFRTAVPLATAVLDWWFLGRQLPAARSWAALGGILVGAAGYMYYDSSYNVTAYAWVAIWFALFLFDSIYIKHVCDTVRMSTWGRVLYTNFMAMLPAMFLAAAGNEYTQVKATAFTYTSVSVIALSCILGALMSYTSFWLRKISSATTFTLTGVLCKIASVALNCTIWDKHASPQAIMCLMICLLCGTAYRQPPMREERPKAVAGPAEPLLVKPAKFETV